MGRGGASVLDDDGGDRGSPTQLLRRAVLVASVASFLDAESVCRLAGSHPLLWRLLTRGPLARDLWRHLSERRWTARPLRVNGEGAKPRRAGGSGGDVDMNWRLWYVTQAALDAESELEVVDATRRVEADMHAFRRRRTSHSNGAVGLLGNLVAFADPRVAQAMSREVAAGAKSLIVHTPATIEAFRRHTRHYSVAFMPLAHTGHWASVLPSLPVVDAAATRGWLGWAHELAILHPALEEHRSMLRHFFRDRAVFETRADAIAWAGGGEAVDGAGKPIRTVSLDDGDDGGADGGATLPVRPRMRFAVGSVRPDLHLHPREREQRHHAARARCMTSMRAMCNADHAAARRAGQAQTQARPSRGRGGDGDGDDGRHGVAAVVAAGGAGGPPRPTSPPLAPGMAEALAGVRMAVII